MLVRSWRMLVLCMALGGPPGLDLWAEEAASDDLRKTLQALEAEVGRLKSEAAAAERIAELERRIDLLAQEVEKQRTGGATETASLKGAKGFAPAASKVYGISRGVSIGGYGEAVYENFSRQREDGAASGRTDQFDFLRQIVYVGYKFNDKILFNSEMEFEHASAGPGRPGEISVEFAYVDFEIAKPIGFRAGMVLVPMGFLNELHEPPIFHGARRPDVESAVIPSTWRENGAGFYGDVGPVQWRAYVVSGLSSSGFGASGLRGGRQHGARSKAEDLAFTGRVDYRGVEGLLVGASFFTGDSGQGATMSGATIGGRVSLYETHVQYEHRGLQLRLLGARGTVDDTALINKKNNLTGNRSVGEGLYGWYAQAAYDVMSLKAKGEWSVTPFVRYERIDTQDGVPAGFQQDPTTDRNVLTVGVGLKPIPNVALKADFQKQSNKSETGVNQFNLAVGFLF